MWEQDFYIPFYRVFEDPVSKQEFLSGPRGAKKHISAQIRQLKGGEAQIGDLLENSLTNWMHLIDASARNMARTEAFNAGTEVGIIEEVPKKDLINILGQKKIERFAVVKPEAKRAIALFDSKEEAEQYIDAKGSGYEIEPRKETIVKFGNMKDLGVLSFQQKGKPIYFRTDDPDLYEALAEIDNKQMNNFLMKWMGKAKRGLSYGATFGPLFRVRNAIRDTVHTAIVSKDFIPVYDTVKGFVKAMAESEEYREYMASGFGFGSSYVNADDPESGAKFLRSIVKKEGRGALKRILYSPAKFLNFWEKIGTASENAVRVQLYSNLKKKGADNLEAGFEARDLMDFSMRGSSGTVEILTRTIPFLNARFQGLYKLGRSAKENPKSFLLKSAMLSAASMALWGAFKDDDRYKELEDWDKWTYYHFWFNGDHYRIPKPFEVGAFFSSLPESVGNVLNDTEDKKFIADWAAHTAYGIFNIGLPQLIKPVIEERMNKSTFTGRPIVPDYIAALPAADQAYPWTSETAREIGKHFGISPLKIQHYIRGYFATTGMIGLNFVDEFTSKVLDYPVDPADEIKPWSLAKMIRDEDIPQRNTKYTTAFYDMAKEIDNAKRTFRYYTKTDQPEKAVGWKQEKAGLMSMSKQSNSLKSELSDINAEIKRVQRSKRYSAERKQELINRLQKRKNRMTKQWFELVRKNKKTG